MRQVVIKTSYTLSPRKVPIPVYRKIGPGRQEHQVPQLLLRPQHMEDVPLSTVHQQIHQSIAALLIQAHLVGQHYAAVVVGGVGPGLAVQG